jgi:tetratricopeptide (TPR) repeat protein
MNRAWDRRATVALLLSLSLLAFCRSSSVQQDPGYEINALEQYSEGNFRNARDLLLKKSTLYPSERYMLARCYQQLEEYDKAVSNFRLTSVQQLRSEGADPILYQSYCYYFADALIDSPVVYNDSVAIASNLAISVPTNSFYYEDTFESYLYSEFKRTNANALAAQRVSLFYRRVGEYLNGDTSHVVYILSQYDNAPTKNFYRRVIEMIDPASLTSTEALNAAIDIAVDFKKFDLAVAFLNRHYELSRDKDYFTRNSARIEYKRGNQTAAIKQLTDFVATGAASRKTFSSLLKYLYSKRDYTAAYPIVVRAMKQYPGYFYDDYIKVAGTLTRSPNFITGSWRTTRRSYSWKNTPRTSSS